MPTVESAVIANEKSSLGITVTFTDEDGDALTPSTITWTLSDADGDAINSRDGVSVAVPASEITIVLSGDDLEIQSGEISEVRATRHLTIEATYNSDLGSDLPFKDVLVFYVNNLSHIT